MPGPANIESDARSRYPMLGPRQLNRVGIANAMDVLLKALPAGAAATRRIWLWAGHDTELLQEKLKAWLAKPERIYTRGVGESIRNPAWRGSRS